MKENYVYANMRIKALENFFLRSSDFDAMLGLASEEEILGYLQSKGWKFFDSCEKIDRIIKDSEVFLWKFIKEIVGSLDFFDVILLKKDFSNLKAIVRGVLSDIDVANFLDGLAKYNPDDLYKNVKEQHFDALPEYMKNTAKDAFSVLLKTADACLCDSLIDRGMFEAMKVEGRSVKSRLVSDFVELLCVSANINIALRSINFKRNTRAFLLKALIPCSTFDLDSLIAAALKGKDCLVLYFDEAVYKGFPAFVYKDEVENVSNWTDYSIFCILKKEISKCFGLDPIFAFVLYKYLEFKNLRLVSKNLKNAESLDKLRGSLGRIFLKN